MFETPGPESMIGVATLPADRFLALEPQNPARPGVLDTPPVRFEGRDLLVNAEVEPGDLQVELMDEQGPVVQFQTVPLVGFEREHSKLVRHDDMRYRVVWRSEGSDRTLADALPGRPLIIRFTVHRGRVFAFQIV